VLCDSTYSGDFDLKSIEAENYALVRFSAEHPAVTDEAQTELILGLREPFRARGWPAIEDAIQKRRLKRENVAAKLFEVFMLEDAFAPAWDVIKPYLNVFDDYSAQSKLLVAKVAIKVGQMVVAERFLRSAISEGLSGPEEIQVALISASAVSAPDLEALLLDRLKAEYPSNPITLQALYSKHFAIREFDAAVAVAERLGDSLRAEHARAFSKSKIAPALLFAEAEKSGCKGEILISCAEEALYRDRIFHALAWAREVPPSDALFEDACIVRVNVLRRALRSFHRIVLDEFKCLLGILAANPRLRALRGALDHLSENALEEPLSVAILSGIVFELIERQASVDEASLKAGRELQERFDYREGAQTEREFEQFFEVVTESFMAGKFNAVIAGEAELPPEARALVGANLVRELANGIVEPPGREDLGMSLFWLHWLCLACKVVGDPNMDMMVALMIIEYHGSLGHQQESRNIAEHALQICAPLQPEHAAWRTAQGWAALAEACVRSRNPVAALRYICLSLLAHQGPTLKSELLRRWYRLAARVFRDLRENSLAARCIEFEEALLDRLGDYGDSRHTLEVLKLQCELPEKLAGTVEDQLDMLTKSEELLGKGVESETLPLLAIQASILRLVPAERLRGGVFDEFERRIAAIPEYAKSIFGGIVRRNPTKAEIGALIDAIPNAQDAQYLAFQIAPVLPAVANALKIAADSADCDLFLLASGPLSQPALGVKPAESGKDEKEKSFVRWVDIDRLREGTSRPADRYSFQALSKVSLEALQGCLGTDENALVISGEPGAVPYAMLVSRVGASRPRLLESWSPEAFYQWRKTYKNALFWRLPRMYLPGIDSIEPEISTIKRIFQNLALNLDVGLKKLTILPSSWLFGFTWQLSPFEDRFLAEEMQVAIAPSASWLTTVRASKWSGERIRRAWIGSSKSENVTLINLRSLVSTPLESFGFSIENGSAPEDFGGSELVFIGAHGGTGVGDYFRSVGDAVNYFAPSDFARLLTGSGCVMLAVCSGGRSDRQIGSEEALGLVAELFRVGVRCVVAAPWPLDIEVVGHWLPVFLDSMNRGETVGNAAERARNAVRLKIDHPCAWAQMHVYGDQNYSLAEH
jgi:hypothetical protein